MISRLVGELEDIRWASVEHCVRVADANRDVIAGVKLRAGYQMVGPDPRPAVGLALEAADALRLPLMVHVIDMGMPLPELLARMRAGDVVTHCFHGNDGGLLDEEGRVWPEAFAARERGILFDVGHGSGSFTWRIAREALAQGFPPDTISSDIHTYNHAGPVHDLPCTLSKLLHLGMPLGDVIAAATSRVGAHLGHVAPAGLGTLATGAPGDLSLLELQRGSFPLCDGEHRLSDGVTESAGERLVARSVVRAGTVVACGEPA
jgi:dihydroorotase